MNLTYVESFLTNCLGNSPEFVVEQSKILLREIKEYNKNLSNVDSIQKDLSVINSFQLDYDILVAKYSKDLKELPAVQRARLLNEILMLIGSLEAYSNAVLHRNELREMAYSENKKDKAYYKKISSSNELYKYLKVMYQDMIKSVTAEINLEKEQLRYQIEKLRLES